MVLEVLTDLILVIGETKVLLQACDTGIPNVGAVQEKEDKGAEQDGLQEKIQFKDSSSIEFGVKMEAKALFIRLACVASHLHMVFFGILLARCLVENHCRGSH
jgi:hypothetical protein